MSSSEFSIVLRPPFKLVGIITAISFFAFIGMGAPKTIAALEQAVTFQLLFYVATTGLASVLLSLVLYKNIFWHEKLTLLHSGVTEMASSHPKIVCSDLLAIELLPLPEVYTFEYKLEGLGFTGEKLVFITKGEMLPFGISLSPQSASDLVKQVERFCGRPLLRPPSSTAVVQDR